MPWDLSGLMTLGTEIKPVTFDPYSAHLSVLAQLTAASVQVFTVKTYWGLPEHVPQTHNARMCVLYVPKGRE